MAFYIHNSEHTYVYSEDGSTKYTTPSDGKGYDTEAAAQAVIDSNPTWIATEKSGGATFSVVERD